MHLTEKETEGNLEGGYYNEEDKSKSVEEVGREVKAGIRKSRNTAEGRASRRRKESFATIYNWYRRAERNFCG